METAEPLPVGEVNAVYTAEDKSVAVILSSAENAAPLVIVAVPAAAPTIVTTGTDV